MDADSNITLAQHLRWVFLWCLPAIGIAGAAALILNLPALRMERARLFLDILQLGLKRGCSPEESITAASATRDNSLGARFHLLAARIRSGVRFDEALRLSTSLVPHRIAAILTAGSEAGVFAGALRAARRGANFPNAQIRAAISCQIVMLFIINPLILATLPFFLTKVFPVLREISVGFGRTPPAGMNFIMSHATEIFALQLASIFFLYGGAVVYTGGNRLTRWIEAGLYPFCSWIALRIPWKRKRLHRDFASMLALLLDAGLPEPRALELAGEATGNEIFIRRVHGAIDGLRAGSGLGLALERLDPPGEFSWRLANALQRKGGFSKALDGWLDALNAEADAQEQAAGDFISTALLVGNGIVVGLIIAVVMQCVYGFSLESIR